jgi:hypothetical protein
LLLDIISTKQAIIASNSNSERTPYEEPAADLSAGKAAYDLTIPELGSMRSSDASR